MLREKETEMEKLCGYRLKIEERTGEKLEDILHQSNPWSGIDCERKNCLLFETKQETGKGKKTRAEVGEMYSMKHGAKHA